jgi:hypothetical protein
MTAMHRLQGLLLCGTLAAFFGIAQAQSGDTDATTTMDDAAVAADQKAEAAADAQAKEIKDAAESEMEDVRGPSMQEEMTGGDEHSD